MTPINFCERLTQLEIRSLVSYTFDGHKLRFCGAASGRDDRGGTPLPQEMKSAGYAHAQYTIDNDRVLRRFCAEQLLVA